MSFGRGGKYTQVFEDLYPEFGSTLLVQKLGLTKPQIRRIAHELGIKMNPRHLRKCPECRNLLEDAPHTQESIVKNVSMPKRDPCIQP